MHVCVSQESIPIHVYIFDFLIIDSQFNRLSSQINPLCKNHTLCHMLIIDQNMALKEKQCLYGADSTDVI